MSAQDRIPTNRNFLSPFGYNFSIFKTPNVDYFVQAINIPALTLGTVDMATPFQKLLIPGDKVDFGTLTATIRVDEELRNYLELYNWIIQVGFPDTFDQYLNIANANIGEGVLSDATLTVLSSARNPILNVKFSNLYPVSISDLNFDSRQTDLNYIDVDVNFHYQSFKLEYLI